MNAGELTKIKITMREKSFPKASSVDKWPCLEPAKVLYESRFQRTVDDGIRNDKRNKRED